MNRINNINNISDLAVYDTVIRNHSKILIKDTSICDDIVNDCYINLDKYFKKYPNKTINGGFVSVMIRNIWRNYLKKITNKYDYGNSTSSSVIPESEIDYTDIENKIQDEVIYEVLEERIQKLDNKDKKLLENSFNKSISKISRENNVNYHKLLKQYHNIIKKLKEE